jgi:hypothetical protein
LENNMFPNWLLLKLLNMEFTKVPFTPVPLNALGCIEVMFPIFENVMEVKFEHPEK